MNASNPLSVAARVNPVALRSPCEKEGSYASRDIARRELLHIQQNVRGRFSRHYPKRYYFCELHDCWHLTSREV